MKALIDGDRYCSCCATQKPSSEFHKGAHYCKPCANEKARKQHARRMASDPSYRVKKKDSHVKSVFGITLEEYNGKLHEQVRCGICGVDLLSLNRQLVHLDHCHSSGNIREFLCTNCNRGLGHFKDSIEFLTSAINYLEKHNEQASDSK